MGNIHVKLYEIWNSDSEEVKEKLYGRTHARWTKTNPNSSP